MDQIGCGEGAAFGWAIAGAVAKLLDRLAYGAEVQAHDGVQANSVERLVQNQREVVAIGSPSGSKKGQNNPIIIRTTLC